MTKLTDTQTILLSTASQRENGSLYPFPATLRSTGGTTKSIATLASLGLVEERETTAAESVSRTDADLRFGMFVTMAGLQAIGVEPEQQKGSDPDRPSAVPAPAPATAKPPQSTKTAAVLAMLQRSGGATLAELIETTGWLPHTTRAALTGLKKKGHTVERFKREGVTCYWVTAA